MTSTGRRPRRSAEQTRELLVERGLAALHERGLSVGLDAVTLETAFREADLPRSSAYAAWASQDPAQTPQETFQREVLRRAIRSRLGDLSATADTGQSVLDALDPDAAPAQNLRNVLRAGSEVNFAIGISSTIWRLVMALQALLGATPGAEVDEELAGWLSAAEAELRETSIATIYRPLGELIGFEPRPEFGEQAWELMAISAGAFAEGLVARHRLDGARPHLTDIDRDGEPWTLLALGLEALVHQFFDVP